MTPWPPGVESFQYLLMMLRWVAGDPLIHPPPFFNQECQEARESEGEVTRPSV